MSERLANPAYFILAGAGDGEATEPRARVRVEGFKLVGKTMLVVYIYIYEKCRLFLVSPLRK